MGRPKKIRPIDQAVVPEGHEIVCTPDGSEFAVVPVRKERQLISILSVDYPSESLNDMARKINELIDYLNAGK